MNRKSVGALIVLNVVLLVALFMVGLTPQKASAQLGGGPEFLMVAGKTAGRDSVSTIYLMELRSAQMLAVQYDSRNDSVEVVGARHIGQDLAR